MMAKLLILLIFVFGAAYTVYSALLLFSDRFYRQMETKVWSEQYSDKTDAEAGRVYNKYIRGITGLGFGIVMAAMAVYFFLTT